MPVVQKPATEFAAARMHAAENSCVKTRATGRPHACSPALAASQAAAHSGEKWEKVYELALEQPALRRSGEFSAPNEWWDGFAGFFVVQFRDSYELTLISATNIE